MKWIIPALFAAPAFADDATIDDALAERSGDTWSVSVTLSHGDTGWDDYADGWRVVDAEGEVIGTRVLAHPHVNEQPFTRSLGGLKLEEGVAYFIEAKTLTDGWGEAQFPLNLE